jgi:hypothetical protein
VRLRLLYARSRGTPRAGLALVGLCVAGAWAGRWLVARPALEPDTARLPVTVALALAVAVVVSGTLHSAADDLERTTPRNWAAWRAGHAAAAALVAVVAVLPVLPAAVHGQQALLRNTIGLLGLALLTAAALGPRLCWTVPLGYTATVYLAGSPDPGAGRPVWAFLLQPAPSALALLTALSLLVAGSAAWAAHARHRR